MKAAIFFPLKALNCKKKKKKLLLLMLEVKKKALFYLAISLYESQLHVNENALA